MKLPKLPSFKLPKLFKRGGDDDDFDDEDFDDEDDEGSGTVVIDDENVGGDDADTGTGGESDGDDSAEGDHDGDADDDDDDWDDDDDDDDETGGRRKALIFAAAGGAVLLIGIAAGGAYWMLGGEDDVAEDPSPTRGSVVAMDMPPATRTTGGLNQLAGASDGSADGGLTPPGAAQPAAAGGSEELQNLTLGTDSLNAIAGAGQSLEMGLVVPAVSSAAFRSIADVPAVGRLPVVPIAAVAQKVGEGVEVLPRIGPDGEMPWQVYSRPFNTSGSQQRIAILVVGVGLSRASSMAAILKLPADVSLSVDPYAKDPVDWLVRSRRSGHEVFLSLPLESDGFPVEDAGPLALTTYETPEENLSRLDQLMQLFPGYVGVATSMGSRFNVDSVRVRPILQVLKERGLMYFDGGIDQPTVAPQIAAEIGLPKAFADLVIDDIPSGQAIDARLAELEVLVRDRANVIAIAHAYPITVERLTVWLRTLAEKQLVLAPVSALADKQFVQ